MKKQPEYIFSDELKPKSLLGKLLYIFGYRKPLKDNHVIIERPSFEELGIPSNDELDKIIANLAKNFLGYGNHILAYLKNITGSETEENILDMVEQSHRVIMLAALTNCQFQKLVFFDGQGYYISDLGRMVYQRNVFLFLQANK